METRPNINWETAKQHALKATEYKSSTSTPSLGDGLFHGELGRIRNQNLQAQLQKDVSDKKLEKKEFIASMLAIFGEVDPGFLGRKYSNSSWLAGLIAGKWITGDASSVATATYTRSTNTLASNIFAAELFERSKNVYDNWDVSSYGGFGLFARAETNISDGFNKVKAANWLLKEIIKLDYSETEQQAILRLAKAMHDDFLVDKTPRHVSAARPS